MESRPIPLDQLTVEQAQDEIKAALNGWIKKATESNTGATVDYLTTGIGHTLYSLHAAGAGLRPHNEPLGRHLDHASEQADRAYSTTDEGLERTLWQCAVAYLRQAERHLRENQGAER
jgi:hypothetical protein